VFEIVVGLHEASGCSAARDAPAAHLAMANIIKLAIWFKGKDYA
jgi:hypothetical protein